MPTRAIHSPTNAQSGQAGSTRSLLLGGALAGPIFVGMFLIEGATRPSYDPLRHPVSSLAFGALGWQQIATFLVSGLLMLAFAIGLRRALARLHGPRGAFGLVAAFAIGLIGAGLFVADPISGYPPGSPAERVATVHGVLHDLFGVPIFIGFPVVCLIFSRWFARRGSRGWAIGTAVSGLGFVVAFVLSSAGFNQAAGLVEYGGLFQRTALIIAWIWFGLLAVWLRAEIGQPAARAARP